MTKFNTKINTVGTFSSSKSVYFTPLLPTSCVSGIGFLQCHKKNIDITKKHTVFLISLFEVKLDFYSVLYNNNTKTTFKSNFKLALGQLTTGEIVLKPKP